MYKKLPMYLFFYMALRPNDFDAGKSITAAGHQDIAQVGSWATCSDRRTAAVQQGFFNALEAMLPVFRQIFSQFQDVANAEGWLPPAKQKTVHHTKTTGPPPHLGFAT
jgi:hypothetical protein